MKILQIGLSFIHGGIENCILNYCRHMNHTQFTFDFVDMYGQGIAFSEEITRLGGKIHTLSNYKKHPVKAANGLKAILANTPYDIVHINSLSAANLIPVWVALHCNVKHIIVHSHNCAIPKGLVRKLMNGINVKILRALPVLKWACGVNAGKWMWGEAFNKENVVYNAIDFQKHKKEPAVRTKMRSLCGFADDNKVVGFVGRLCEAKNPRFLLDVLHALRKTDTDWRLLVVGDGELKQKFFNKIAFLKLEKFVFFAGMQDAVSDWYQAMDVFVLPSLFEGLPVVGVEAQASGLSCIFSNCITDEIDLLASAQHLPIDKGAAVWAQAIIATYGEGTNKNLDFPKEYQIEYAAKCLEHKYRELAQS